MKSLNIAVSVGIAVTIDLIYKLIFQIVSFANFLMMLKRTGSDVCYVDALRSVILSLLIIIILPSVIKYFAINIDKNYKFEFSSSIIYVIFTLMMINSKMLVSVVYDISKNNFLFSDYTMMISFALLVILVTYLIILLKKNTISEELIENFMMIIKTMIIVNVLAVITSIIFYITKINNEYKIFDDFVDYMLEMQIINIVFISILLVITIALGRKLKKTNVINHVILLCNFFIVTPILINYSYTFLVSLVNFIKYGTQAENAFNLMLVVFRDSLLYASPILIVAAYSFYIFNKNYFTKKN